MKGERNMDIYAFHHTTKEKAELILLNGFNEDYFKKVSIGFGVQCHLEQKEHCIYMGKEDGQIKVEFRNCRLLNDPGEIYKSTERIQAANYNQKEIAKEEADRLKSNGYDAYMYNSDVIVFLNYPEAIEWIPFNKQEITRKTLKDEINELANDSSK